MTGLRLQGRGKHGPSERARGKPPAGPGSRTSQHEPRHPVPFPWGRGDVLSRLHWGAAWSGPAESLGELGGAAGAPCTGTVGWHRPPDLKHLGGVGQGLWGGLTVMQFLTLKSGGSWRGMGWLGRCPEKGRAVSFLLWISWGEFPCISMRATPSGEGDKKPKQLGSPQRAGWDECSAAWGGTWIPLQGKRCC